MAKFADSEELSKVMLELWARIQAHPEMSGKLIASKLITQFRYRNPDGIITIDCSDGKTMNVISGPGGKKPVIEMSMKADIAHEFWMGRVNVPVALLTGKIVSKGPTPRALQLLPVIRPAFELYPEVLKEMGAHALLSK